MGGVGRLPIGNFHDDFGSQDHIVCGFYTPYWKIFKWVGWGVSGRAASQQGELRRFDVVFVLDVSGSTFDATGVDINANGVVGRNLNSRWMV